MLTSTAVSMLRCNVLASQNMPSPKSWDSLYEWMLFCSCGPRTKVHDREPSSLAETDQTAVKFILTSSAVSMLRCNFLALSVLAVTKVLGHSVCMLCVHVCCLVFVSRTEEEGRAPLFFSFETGPCSSCLTISSQVVWMYV